MKNTLLLEASFLPLGEEKVIQKMMVALASFFIFMENHTKTKRIESVENDDKHWTCIFFPLIEAFTCNLVHSSQMKICMHCNLYADFFICMHDIMTIDSAGEGASAS